MLHRLEALEHTKVHNIGNKSKGGLIVVQGMTVDVSKGAVLFQSGERVLDSDSDLSLLGVSDLLRTSKFFVVSGSFEGNDRMQQREILMDSLVS